MMKPKLLDLFSGAGGSAKGYQRAGFYVVGVDIRPQPHYCGDEFVLGDALEYVAAHGAEYDAIHASPPCQRYSRSVRKSARGHHPDLVNEARTLLMKTRKPFVIENVERAPLLTTIVLCGSSFGLMVRRHRLFESNVMLMGLPCRHSEYIPQYPPAHNRNNPLRFIAISGGWQHLPIEMEQRAMGIDWMTGAELTLAIPPAYTAFIGAQLLAYLSRTPAPAGAGVAAESEK